MSEPVVQPTFINWRLPYDEYMKVLNHERSLYKRPSDADDAQIDGAIMSISSHFQEQEQRMARTILRRNLIIPFAILGDKDCHPLFLTYAKRFDEFPWCLSRILAEINTLYIKCGERGQVLTIELFASYFLEERYVSSNIRLPSPQLRDELSRSDSV